MIRLTLGEVADIVGGTLRHADPHTVVTGTVEFDSRQVTPGGLFLALPGERVDGHDYVAAVTAAGAVASLVTRPVDAPSIEVADGFAALAALAGAVARRLPDTVVIGITGSSGKTSTKDLLAQVLARAGRTVAPPGSFNNELGHPYTVLRATPDTRFLVLETSARGIGHIRYLTGIAQPRIGVVLNVGSAHLGEFGSREAIAQAKGELVEALPAEGVAILNADDPLVAGMAPRTAARVVTYGVDPTADVRAEGVTFDELMRGRFTLVARGERAGVALRLVGAHHVSNALAAAAVALECGMALGDVAAALGDATPTSRWRMEITERADGVLVINDAYNANPESMRAALDALAAVGRARSGAGGRTFAVLGSMAELGDATDAEHVALGQRAAALDISRVVAVGEVARAIGRGTALEGSWSGTAGWVPDADAALALLRAELRAPDVVLVKASRAAALERVALALAGDTVTDGDSSTAEDGGSSA
ncbi:MAG TPA: UDP-N-acetylmuramoyl-tripeptide--D-alanyl-D-alanine ligase [Jatrophihabitans sp.]|jgi:UDP-N-acetylmuramoyl-tripeptide--D-alanyl-D-alanine ligase|uniref:UDP-N-acetylmuramoyl-tripeptide--D-alanyl-D- alanine ligase n=1 Tax=Jatrophihabitans sp. TaxID=1932789 RepID=UPI002DF96144|nr:UDP-N-acetylmuramoyl-tripeptide--D-alanyl-D-alanine ligase [Jatrophihabitans sp.]